MVFCDGSYFFNEKDTYTVWFKINSIEIVICELALSVSEILMFMWTSMKNKQTSTTGYNPTNKCYSGRLY